MMKATHFGTCQICGRQQKLPGGRMAKHGYTTRWNFFQGVCTGADHLPFEQSIDLIQNAIENAKSRIVALQSRIAELRTPATTPVCYANVYITHRNSDRVAYGKGEYHWVKGTISRPERGTLGGGKVWGITVESGICAGKMFGVDGPGFLWDSVNSVAIEITAEMVATHNNGKLADSIAQDVSRLEEYINWQERRIAGWQPSELQAIGS
jgi:hypothetical protein